MQRKFVALTLSAILLILAATQIHAQGTLTLEGLAKQIGDILTRLEEVEAYEERISTLESQIAQITASSPEPSPTDGSTPTPTLTPTPTPVPTHTSTPAPTVVRISAVDLIGEWEGNEVAADSKYPGKLIEVYGSIIDVERKGGLLRDPYYEVTLYGGVLSYVNCNFDLSKKGSLLSLRAGQTVSLRGRVSHGNPSFVTIENCDVVKRPG